MSEPTSNRRLRQSVYLLLITLSAGAMLGRILAVNSVDRIGIERVYADQGRKDWRRQRPFLSANDRSRWLTIRALVERGTYAIDELVVEPGWDTIDMVQHADRQGVLRLYSSKPPLLPTLIAGEYWLIYRLTGATLKSHPYAVARTILITVNWLPLLLLFGLVARWCERYATTDWGRMFIVASAAFGTFLTTFAITLNNHLPAAVFAAIATDAALRIAYEGRAIPGYFLIAGLAAGMAAAMELPAAALVCLLGGWLLWQFPWLTLLAYTPGALLVAAAFFGTNYVAHGSFKPAYMHRSPGDNWYDYTYEKNGRVVESYWKHPVGVDRGEPSPARYAFHVLLGHHGVFSLNPIWLLSMCGAIRWLKKGPRPHLAAVILSLTVICLAFYLSRPLEYRNYGGMTSGFRWMFWFTPLWLLVMVPAADALSRSKPRRALALMLLGLSVLSVSYPTWNPWTHPWLYDLWQQFS